jgi:transposase
VSESYEGRQYVGIDLHRRRSVIVRQTAAGERLGLVRIDNEPVALSLEIAKAGPDPEVVLEATYGWYWAADVLTAAGAHVHLAHPLGVKAFTYRRVKNDERDAADLCDLLRMGRLPEAYLAPPQVRELRELVRHRAKLVALRSGLKAQVHAVLAKQGVQVRVSDLFGACGRALLESAPLDPPYRARVNSLLRLIEAYDFEVELLTKRLRAQLGRHRGYWAVQHCPGSGPRWPRCSSPRSVRSSGSPAPANWSVGPG